MGDSVRGSLKTLALDRLGRIDELLVADRFFSRGTAAELAARDGFAQEWAQASPRFCFRRRLVETSAEKLLVLRTCSSSADGRTCWTLRMRP